MKVWARGLVTVLLGLSLAACDDQAKILQLPISADTHQGSAQLAQVSGTSASLAALQAYQQSVAAALQANPPVLLLTPQELNNELKQQAQQLAVNHSEVQKHLRDPKSGAALRNEVMSVRQTLPADFSGNAGACAQGQCYRVEIYSHFDNSSTLAFVDPQQQKVLAVSRQPYAQPDLPPRLVELAKAIADAAPEVKAVLAEQAGKVQAGKAEFKTALNDSLCERSHHLCVAPTYVFEQDALWAIVDLTEGKLIGTRWTDLGASGPRTVVTERSLENEATFHKYCEQVNQLKQDAWSMDYVLTGSDGLQLSNVRYQGKPVLKNVKLLDWHVSYSSREGFGYSDAIGCPLFSAAVVIAYDGPKTEPIVQAGETIGFAVIQDFRQPPWPTPCNYRYVQRFEFYKDGSFRVAQADFGRGCGTDGTYRPVVRIDIDTSHEGIDQVAEWKSNTWSTIQNEQWRLQNQAELTTEGYQYRFTNQQGEGYYLEPGQGQFNDAGRGDHAFSYLSVRKLEEGEQDTVTLGSCCNTDYKQGPEQFIEPPEPLANKDLVLWYVPQMKNDGNPGSEYCWADTRVKDGVQDIKVWPCWSGPMFVPVKRQS